MQSDLPAWYLSFSEIARRADLICVPKPYAFHLVDVASMPSRSLSVPTFSLRFELHSGGYLRGLVK